MKNNRLMSFLKTKRPYVVMAFALPVLFATCREQERQAERDSLNTQISDLDKQIYQTRDLHTARVPQNLRNTQSRYNNAADSLDKCADTVGLCMMQNEDLLLFAFNNYATRVGRDFQMSKFLSESDIAILKNHITGLDSMDYVVEMARMRILSNMGSLNDLSYFLEFLDFDSVNSKLENKLAWNFYIDTTTTDTEPIEVSTLDFANPELNAALRTEKNLLNRAWRKNTMQDALNKNDSLRVQDIADIKDSVQYENIYTKYDSLQKQIISEFETMDEFVPNFDIPEFDSVRIQYMRNDSMIREYNKIFDNMLNAEDSLIQYRQDMVRKRDSLVSARQKLEK